MGRPAIAFAWIGLVLGAGCAPAYGPPRAPDPEAVRALSRARDLAKEGKEAEARAALEEAVRADPLHLPAQRLRFREAEARGRGLEVLSEFLDAAIEGNRPEMWLLVAEAVEDPGLAWKAWKKARARVPPRAESSRTRAVLATLDGDPSGALAWARGAAEAEPARADLQAFLGECARRAGRYDDALAAYETALRLDPDEGAALRGIARIREIRGESLAAAEAYVLAIERRLSTAASRRRLRGLAGRGLPPALVRRAAQALAAAAAARPDNRLLAADRAFALHALGQADEAISLYRAAAAKGPLEADHLLDWRLLSVETGDAAAAVRLDALLAGFARGAEDSLRSLWTELEEAARAAGPPSGPAAWRRFAAACRAAGWLPEAEAALGRVLREAPGEPGAREALEDLRRNRRLIEDLRAFLEQGYRDLALGRGRRTLSDLEEFLQRKADLPAGLVLPERLSVESYFGIGWVLRIAPAAPDPLARHLEGLNLYANAGVRPGGTLEGCLFPRGALCRRSLPLPGGERAFDFVCSAGRIVDTYDEWLGVPAAGGAVVGHAVIRLETLHDAALEEVREAALLDPAARDPWTVPLRSSFAGPDPARLGPLGPASARIRRAALRGRDLERWKRLALEETELHEGWHLVDEERLLPFRRHVFRDLWLVLSRGFSGRRILAEMEGRAELAALAAAADPRLPLSHILDVLPAPGIRPPYSRGYAPIAADLVAEIRGHAPQYPEIEAGPGLPLALERLSAESLRQAARRVAEKRLGTGPR